MCRWMQFGTNFTAIRLDLFWNTLHMHTLPSSSSVQAGVRRLVLKKLVVSVRHSMVSSSGLWCGAVLLWIAEFSLELCPDDIEAHITYCKLIYYFWNCRGLEEIEAKNTLYSLLYSARVTLVWIQAGHRSITINWLYALSHKYIFYSTFYIFMCLHSCIYSSAAQRICIAKNS